MRDLFIIAGPTAVGKTKISVEIAKELNGEVVSADSMQIYRYMDIGSAKVSKEEMQNIPHYMIDIVDPSQEFSVAEYKEMAQGTIEDIFKRSKVPILAGGTGLFINSIICNYNFTEVSKDEEYRAFLTNLADKNGKEYVHDLLKEVDPESYKRLYPNDLKRVIRALEVFKLTGKPIGAFATDERVLYDIPYDLHYYVITMDREKLYNNINKRVDIMLENGLIEEVQKLRQLGFTPEMQSMKGIGYKEILYYLDGKISLSDAVELIKQGSRNYAKRQLTWFRKDKRAIWINKDDFNNDDQIIQHIIEQFNKNNNKNSDILKI